MGIAALISAPPANGKRSCDRFRIVPADNRTPNYNNFTNMNLFCNVRPAFVQLLKASLQWTERPLSL
jgi:hypothetical protein